MTDFVTITLDAVDVAWDAIDSLLTQSTVYLNPTATLNPATDTTVKTWGATKTPKAFFYDDSDDQKEDAAPVPDASAAGMAVKFAVLRMSDLEGETITKDAEINDGEFQWRITKVEIPPTRAIVLLSLMR